MTLDHELRERVATSSSTGVPMRHRTPLDLLRHYKKGETNPRRKRKDEWPRCPWPSVWAHALVHGMRLSEVDAESTHAVVHARSMSSKAVMDGMEYVGPVCAASVHATMVKSAGMKKPWPGCCLLLERKNCVRRCRQVNARASWHGRVMCKTMARTSSVWSCAAKHLRYRYRSDGDAQKISIRRARKRRMIACPD